MSCRRAPSALKRLTSGTVRVFFLVKSRVWAEVQQVYNKSLQGSLLLGLKPCNNRFAPSPRSTLLHFSRDFHDPKKFACSNYASLPISPQLAHLLESFARNFDDKKHNVSVRDAKYISDSLKTLKWSLLFRVEVWLILAPPHSKRTNHTQKNPILCTIISIY